jgi:hypothetical protein
MLWVADEMLGRVVFLVLGLVQEMLDVEGWEGRHCEGEKGMGQERLYTTCPSSLKGNIAALFGL